MLTHEQIIAKLQLQPLPVEGGYFRRIYESSQTGDDGRRISASIYYLLTAPDFSCFHRVDCDELWHFYGGETLTIYQILPDGNSREILLGNIVENPSAVPFVCMEKNTWFAAEVTRQSGYSLVGCTTTPEFQYQGFIAGTREQLSSQFPQHKDLIARLTRS